MVPSPNRYNQSQSKTNFNIPGWSFNSKAVLKYMAWMKKLWPACNKSYIFIVVVVIITVVIRGWSVIRFLLFIFIVVIVIIIVIILFIILWMRSPMIQNNQYMLLKTNIVANRAKKDDQTHRSFGLGFHFSFRATRFCCALPFLKKKSLRKKLKKQNCRQNFLNIIKY